MRKIGLMTLAAAFVAGAFCSPARADPDYEITVKKGERAALRIAIVPFDVEEVTAAKAPERDRAIREILSFDLEFSGLFETVANENLLRDLHKSDVKAGKVNYDRWRRLNVDAVLKGKFERRGEGFTLSYMVYHAGDGVFVGGREITGGEERAFRRAIHTASDDILFRLTGRKGIAQTRIAFVQSSGRFRELYLMDYDGHKDSIHQVTHDRGICQFPCWLPSGQGIAFTSYLKRNPDLYLIHFSKSERIPLSLFPGVNYGADFHPTVPNRLALTLSKDGNAEIYRLDLDVSPRKATRLTKNKAIDCSPAYSPGGERIAFTSDRAGNPHIYLMDASGDNVRRLSTGWQEDSAVWSPKGDRIAFASRNRSGGRYDICLVGSDGAGFKNLTGGQRDNQDPDFSPDGHHTVFSSNREGRYQIYVMNLETNQIRRLTWLPGDCTDPCWSPVGN